MPNLTGAAGSLLAVLDAALVSGVTGLTPAGWTKPFANSGNIGCYKNNGGATFNGQISGTTLTVNSISAGAIAIGSIITGAGVAANTTVTAFVSATTAGQTGTYTVNNSQSVGAESMTASAGASGLSGAGNGTGFCMNINDNGPGAGTFKEARINGFETMSALSTGTGQFPTGAQSAIGTGQLVIRKSTTADGTTRFYTIFADQTVVYMSIETGDITAPLAAYIWSFGDFYSYSSTDTSNCAIMARTGENTSNATAAANVALDHFGALSAGGANGVGTVLSNTLVGHFCAANYTNIGGSLAFGKHSDQTKMGLCQTQTALVDTMWMGYQGQTVSGGNNSTWINQFNFPNGPDQGMYAAPVWLHHNGNVRGYFKGMWCPLQHQPLNHNDTYSGTGNLNGKTLCAQQGVGLPNTGTNTASVYVPQIHFETSNTWQ